MSENTAQNNNVPNFSKDEKRKFNAFIALAKDNEKNAHLQAAISYYKQAAAMYPMDKVVAKLTKLENELKMKSTASPAESDEVDCGDGFVRFADGSYGITGDTGDFAIPGETYAKLFSHQKEGVLWLHNLHVQGPGGGILADDMGLGKTIQMSVFFEALIAQKMAHMILIVLPLSLVGNWERELGVWAKGVCVRIFHGSSKPTRERNIADVKRNGGILLTTYGLVVSATEQLSGAGIWDYVVLDEGHKIKNPTRQISKCVRMLHSRHRILLSGTPIQNDLKEMWALFDYCCNGKLFGSERQFKTEYSSAIIRASDRDASDAEKENGARVAAKLRNVIAPFFLRREKSVVMNIPNYVCPEEPATNEDEDGEDTEEPRTPRRQPGVLPNISTNPSAPTVSLNLTRKNDLVVWIPMTASQVSVYKEFITSETVAALLNETRSPLAALVVLKKLCDHPRLLSKNMAYCESLELELTLQSSNEDEGDHAIATDVTTPKPVTDSVTEVLMDNVAKIIEESSKMQVLVQLVQNLHAEGHRVLIFSQSKKVLDMIGAILRWLKLTSMRIDGDVGLMDREVMVKSFNASSDIFCFLLTIQVGGVGLTLTGADRVIIYDPSWNPAIDNQAVDRAYRIGQTRDVTVYRLMTCGTVEEKIYRRQVFKSALSRAATKAYDPVRYFTKDELKELFKLDDPTQSRTQQQLHALHSKKRVTDLELDKHIKFLHTLKIFGISDHDLLFTEEAISALSEPRQAVPMSPSFHRMPKHIRDALKISDKALSIETDGIEEITTPVPKSNTKKKPRKTKEKQTSVSMEIPPLPVNSIDLTTSPLLSSSVRVRLWDEDTEAQSDVLTGRTTEVSSVTTSAFPGFGSEVCAIGDAPEAEVTADLVPTSPRVKEFAPEQETAAYCESTPALPMQHDLAPEQEIAAYCESTPASPMQHDLAPEQEIAAYCESTPASPVQPSVSSTSKDREELAMKQLVETFEENLNFFDPTHVALTAYDHCVVAIRRSTSLEQVLLACLDALDKDSSDLRLQAAAWKYGKALSEACGAM